MKILCFTSKEPRFCGSFSFLTWEQCKLGENVPIIMGQSPDGSTYSDKPSDYILVQGNADLENGWVKPRVWTTQKTKLGSAGDLIMSVRAPAGSMGKTRFDVVLGRGVAAIKGNEFIYQLLVKKDIDGHWKRLSAGSTFESLNSDTIYNAEIVIPKQEEQKRIGELFEYLDNLITLHQCKEISLFLQKMQQFIVEKMAFAWEQRKLNELVTYHSSNLTATDSCEIGKYDLYDANTVIGKTNVEPMSTEYITIIKDGAGVGRIRKMPANTMFIGTMGGIRAEKSNLSFIYALLTRFNLGNEFTGSTIPHIYFKDYGNNEYYVPNIKEQQMHGACFAKIDELITLHQCKDFTSLSRKNYNLPLEFNTQKTTTWEQRKLGNIGKARSGIGFPDEEQGGKSGVPFYKVSDMNLYGNEVEMSVSNNYVTQEQIARKKWQPIEQLPAMFFAKVGAAVMLNRKRLVRFPFLLDNNTMAYSLDNEVWNTDFAKAIFNKINLTSLVQVGALPSYNASDVESMEISLPEIYEQSKIGRLFTYLDELITLHQCVLIKY